MRQHEEKLFIILGFHPSISHHGIVHASMTLLIWLNEMVLALYKLAEDIDKILLHIETNILSKASRIGLSIVSLRSD